jgi:hypothetical protein
MIVSRADADALLRKYTEPDAPLVLVLLISRSFAWTQMFGRLSLEGPMLRLMPELPSQFGDAVGFPLDAVRFDYTDAPVGDQERRTFLKERFEGVLSIVHRSGDRLYIFEPKSV